MVDVDSIEKLRRIGSLDVDLAERGDIEIPTLLRTAFTSRVTVVNSSFSPGRGKY